VTLEGRAVRVTHDALLQRVRRGVRRGRLGTDRADGGFTHEYSASTPVRRRGSLTSSGPRNALRVATKGARRRHPMDLLTTPAGGVRLDAQPVAVDRELAESEQRSELPI